MADIGAIDWSAVEQQAAKFAWLPRLIPAPGRRRHRLGNCSIVVEWLVLATIGTLGMAERVDEDLAELAQAHLPGFARLLQRMAAADREGFFAFLSEVLVAAWYLRSGREVRDVHADSGLGDLVIADGQATAHVEVMELSIPARHTLWRERWSELITRLKLLRLPFGVSVYGPNDVRYTEHLTGLGTWIQDPAPDLHDLDWVVKQVEARRTTPRPWRLEKGFSKKYPDLWIEALDEPDGVVVSSGGIGWHYHPSQLADRILGKPAPKVSGRRVLMVEVSRLADETLIDERERAEVRRLIADRVKSWDAIIAFTRWWKSAGVADVYALHLSGEPANILPIWPGVPWASGLRGSQDDGVAWRQPGVEPGDVSPRRQ